MTEMHTSRKTRSVLARVVVAAVLPLALLASASSADTVTVPTPILLPAPAIPSAPALPGTGMVAGAFTPSATLGLLTVAPNQGVQGAPITISGRGLPASQSVELVWATSKVTWAADVEPNTVNYLGRSATPLNVVIANTNTDASGNFSFTWQCPVDFGGPHTIYAIVNGVELAYGGFEMFRTVTVTPKSGPIGTPVTITYTALGASLYAGGASVLWDNKFVGEMMANWTRGTATTTIRAAGPIGKHFVQVGDGIGTLYLNPNQSPLPYLNGATVPFTVTKDSGPPKPYTVWPNSVAPTVSQVTTLATAGLDPASKAVATLSATSGFINSKVDVSVTGLSGSGTDQVAFATVVGSRVNCSNSTGSGCWLSVASPLASGQVTNGTLSASVTIPDGLGGWHAIEILNGTTVEAQVPFYVKENIVSFYAKNGKLLSRGVATANNYKAPLLGATPAQVARQVAALSVGQSGTGTYTLKQGQEFTISIKGVGWTQMDNTLAVDYDNNNMGYGCGFNSNGYMVIHLFATGGLGTHIIDLYPEMYNLNPAFGNTPYGMYPVLTYATDFPGLALGYQVPSFHFAIKVVK